MILSQEEKDFLQRFSHRGKEPVSCRDNYSLAVKLAEKGVLQFALFGAFRLVDSKYLEEIAQNSKEENTSLLSEETKLSSLMEKGADTVGCVPIEEWLTYTRNLCLKVAPKDDINRQKYWLDAAANIQLAMEQIEKALNES